MRTVISNWIIVIGILLGLYVGGYQLFLKSILLAHEAYVNGAFTIGTFLWTFVKCFFASPIGIMIVYLFHIISCFVFYGKKKDGE